MNFETLASAWNSPENRPSVAATEKLRTQFIRALHRRRRFHLLWLIWTLFALTALTGFTGWLVLGTNRVSVGEQWSLVPLLGIPWAFAIHYLRRFLRQAQPEQAAELPIVETLRASLADNQADRRRLKLIGWLYVIMAPVLALEMWQLHLAGKVASRELISMSVLFSGVIAISGAAVAARYFGRLVPQYKRLEELLGLYDQKESQRPN